MVYDITRLNNDIDKVIEVKEKYSFTLNELKGTDLIKLDNVDIDGIIFKNSLGNIELNISVEGIMILPCAITLKPVEYPFLIDISGEIDDLMENCEEKEINFKNSIDILPIIWENILMEIPMRVVSPDLKNEDFNRRGEGWTFTTNEENASPLSELAKLLNDSEVR